MVYRGHNYPGFFMVLEGPDGSGKSTQHMRILNYLKSEGFKVNEIREPGGTIIGEVIRNLLLNPEYEMMDVKTETLLFNASRAQIISERIRPALEKGEIVLADRFFYSTEAYQGSAGKIPYSDLEMLTGFVCGDLRPDLTVICDVPNEVGIRRRNPLVPDRIEQKAIDYHEKVRQGYLQMKKYPEVIIIDSTPVADEVFETIKEIVAPIIGELDLKRVS